jgi:hypothetical protein
MRRRHFILSLTVALAAAVVTILTFAIPRASGQDRSVSPAEQWEYLIINGGGNVNFTSTDNTSMRKEPGAFAHEDFPLEGNLDKLGKKGWELVTVTDSPRSGVTFIFKRRK